MDNFERVEGAMNSAVSSGIRGFLKENAAAPELYREVFLSDRFRDENGDRLPFRLRALMGDELQRTQDAAVKLVGKNTVFQPSLWYQELAARSVVEPNLNNAELQNSYGVMEPAALLNRMLTGAEYNRLLKEVLSFNELDREYQELVDEVKNG